MQELSTPMPDVHLTNNIPQTTSFNIAAVFKRPHKDVLNSIKQLSCSIEFNQRNFSPVKYTDKKGESRPMYEMTRDGFFFLVMGFTGAKAAAFKEAYITAFNQMESELSIKQMAQDDTRHSREGGNPQATELVRITGQLLTQQSEMLDLYRFKVAALEKGTKMTTKRRAFSDEENHTLLTMWQSGKSNRQIANKLGRKVESVATKTRALRLSVRVDKVAKQTRTLQISVQGELS